MLLKFISFLYFVLRANILQYHLKLIIVFLITKIVSISSMLASLMLIVSYFILGIKDIPLLVMISLMFVLIVYKHRSNIMRLIKGEENKIDFSKKEK